MDLINNDRSTGYTILVDFGKGLSERRFWVYSHKDKRIIISSICSHGSGSGMTEFPTSFSNVDGSHKSSLGLFRIAERYNGYYGISFRLDGLAESNSNARKRAIVIHSAKKMKTSWSWGCFSIPQISMDSLNKMDLTGSYLISYYK
jgi:hypothetical protein